MRRLQGTGGHAPASAGHGKALRAALLLQVEQLSAAEGARKPTRQQLDAALEQAGGARHLSAATIQSVAKADPELGTLLARAWFRVTGQAVDLPQSVAFAEGPKVARTSFDDAGARALREKPLAQPHPAHTALAARGAKLYEAPATLPGTLHLAFPGDLPKELAGKATHKLPTAGHGWPEALRDAEAHLVDKGYQLTSALEGGAKVFTKEGKSLVLAPVTFNAHMSNPGSVIAGYVVTGKDGAHAQLGPVGLDDAQWKLLKEGYDSQLNAYLVDVLPRPLMLRRPVQPLDGSAVHGAHDGLKHLLVGSRHQTRLHKAVDERREQVALESAARVRLKALLDAGKLPQHIAVMVEGTDGASKSGNGQLVLRLLEDVGFKVEVRNFRRPTDDERSHGVTWRYEQYVSSWGKGPRGKLLDRGTAGDYVYSDAKRKDLVPQLDAAERTWQRDGVWLLKFLFLPGDEAPIKTFGKRIARAVIANDLPQRRDDLTQADLASLKAAADFGPGPNDFRSIPAGERNEKRFRKLAEANSSVFKWHVIETEDRHDGHLATLKVLLSELEKLDQKPS